jgi:centrin-3
VADIDLVKVAMRALGFDVKKPDVLKILQTAGTERGLLSHEEFTRVMTEYILQRDPLEEIRRAFQLFDDDNTGKISIKNLRRVAKELGEVLEEDELLAMIEVRTHYPVCGCVFCMDVWKANAI